MVQARSDRMIAEGSGCDMKKRIVRADASWAWSVCDGTVVDITQQGTATQKLRRSQAYRDQAEALRHTGSFGRKYPAEDWFNRMRS
jgi:hypothetical protein